MNAMLVNLRYLSEEGDRHGNTRLYARRFGRRIRIRVEKDAPGFAEAYETALAQTAAPKSGKVDNSPKGSVGWLARAYFASDEFRGLAAQSQRTRRRVIESCLCEAKNGRPFSATPLDKLAGAHLIELRKRKVDKPGAANNRLKYLSAMLGWAVEHGHLPSNPARDVRRAKYASSGFYTWSVEDVQRFETRHPIGTKPRLALALLLFLGVRRGDVVTLGRQHVRDGWIRFVPSKTRYRRRALSQKPVLPILESVIEESPTGDLTFLETSFGKAFTAPGFGNWFRKRCDEAGLPQCSAHGLRKAGATIAAENGATVHQLMAIFDWSNPAQAKPYTDAADRKRMTGDAMRLLQFVNR